MNSDERAAALTLAWAEWYTRGLARRIASERIAELASDLYEHRRAGVAGTPPWMTAVQIVWRMLAGLGADLSWRHTVLAAPRAPGRVLREERSVMHAPSQRFFRLRRVVSTRKCVACGERYRRRLPYCPVCKTLPGHDGIPKTGSCGGGIGMSPGGGV